MWECGGLQGMSAGVPAPSFLETLPHLPWGLTGHAEAEDTAVFLQESLQ